MKRRAWLMTAGGATLGALATPRTVLAAPGATRLERRLELWQNFARGNARLVLRYRSVRKSALLAAPLVQTGALAFESPDHLVFRDDTIDGATTTLRRDTVIIRPNRTPTRHVVQLDADQNTPAMQWLIETLFALLSPDGSADLAGDGTLGAPRSRVPTLEILPPQRQNIRARVRALTVTLAPATGAIASLLLQESQGDEFFMEWSDHRQTLPSEDFERLLHG